MFNELLTQKGYVGFSTSIIAAAVLSGAIGGPMFTIFSAERILTITSTQSIT
jgi:hypothetical protein